MRLEPSYGAVTNLCDFAIDGEGTAWIKETNLGDNRVMCKVCDSRARKRQGRAP